MRLSESDGTLGRSSGEGVQKTPLAPFREAHYTVDEISKLWKLSRDVVRKIFQGEPGVLVIGHDSSRGKQAYHTLRIPESVLARVYRRSCNPDLTFERSRAYSAVKSGPSVVESN